MRDPKDLCMLGMRRSRAENGGVFKGGLGRELGRRGEKESFGGMVVFITSFI